MKKNNKGFTLVEMMIVLGISAIVLTIVLFSYNVINNANVQKSARRLENVIRIARTRCMTKGTKLGELKLYEQNGNIYAVIGNDALPELICNSGVTMKSAAIADYGIKPEVIEASAVSIPPYPGISLKFNSSGTVQTYAGTPNNVFLLHNGGRNYEVLVYSETGSIEVNLY
ncbi:MAG: type II secretion system protein [Lachnospiraceae bacterium]|nr:type II secretion system protein [Lachnospiraceae bacterium]